MNLLLREHGYENWDGEVIFLLMPVKPLEEHAGVRSGVPNRP